MHELSIVASLFEIMEEKAAEKSAKRILSVTLQVGRMSGVVPELLKTAFDIYKKDTPADGASLEIVDVAFQVRCRSCGHEMTADDLVVQCERCGSVDLETLAGTELFLMKMDVEI